MALNKCKFCNKEFKIAVHNQIYCSKKCKWKVENNKRKKPILNKSCIVCNKLFTTNKPFMKCCSLKCSNTNKQILRKYYQKIYFQKNKNNLTQKHKLYMKNNVKQQIKQKKRVNDWAIANTNKMREIYKKYHQTDKGKLNMLRNNEKRRKHNLFRINKKYDEISLPLKRLIDQRDLVCVYCSCKFDTSNKYNLRFPNYDHLNTFLPLNENNTIKSCLSCNTSKAAIDKKLLIYGKEHNPSQILSLLKRELNFWFKRKGYSPSPIVLKLLEKQREGLNPKRNIKGKYNTFKG